MDNTTAKVSCFVRAYHYENNETHIFSDSMAARLLGDDFYQIAESMIQGIGFFLRFDFETITKRTLPLDFSLESVPILQNI